MNKVDKEDYAYKISRLASDMIRVSLNDIKRGSQFTNSKSDTFLRNYRDKENALRWFNERSTSPFGYGWCLQYSGINPNLVRKTINLYLGKKDSEKM